MTDTAERGAHDERFDPSKISPSRVGQLLSCGVAFKLKYLDKVPEEVSGSAALFGSVIHNALEDWGKDRDSDLLTLMRASWLKTTEGTAVKDFIGEFQPISVALIKAEHEAARIFEEKNKRECQAPRMTKVFKESDAAKAEQKLLARWLPRLEKESPWRFTERDPIGALYNESLVIARRYQAAWGHLPNALYTEFAFSVPWRGFTLTGYIDSIELLIEQASGELQGLGVIDYKTYAKEPAEHKDWRQLVIYDVAVRHLVETGNIVLPDLSTNRILCGIDYVRFAGKVPNGEARRFWQITPEDHDALEKELVAYRNTVENEAWLPAEKGRNPDFCPFPSQCCLRTRAAAGGSAPRVEVSL